jgi:predicted RNase H-like HicB family nuclease
MRARSTEQAAEPTYTVLLRQEPEGGFTVWFPAVPGCVTYGATVGEALRMAEEALACHLDCLRDLGKPLPEEYGEVPVDPEDLVGTVLGYRISPAREEAQVA